MKGAGYLLLPAVILTGCGGDETTGPGDGDTFYRQEMRSFVSDLSAWAKAEKPGFIIVPQNGQELVTDTGEGDGAPQTDYLASMDGTGREDLFYGYDSDDRPTPGPETQHMLDLCMVCEQYGVQVLVTDYCWTVSYVDDSYQQSQDMGFISFAADQRDLNTIPGYPPVPWNVNTAGIESLGQAQNFLYLINGENYPTKQDFLNAVAQTDYDVVIMDLFHNEEQFTPDEIAQLRNKNGGGTRLVLCYMSIGEAEDYRYYWQSGWSPGNPSWLESENPYWPGNYKVRYWDQGWQAIIFGNEDSYLQRIMDSGFDGAYLDLIDAYEYFEDRGIDQP